MISRITSLITAEVTECVNKGDWFWIAVFLFLNFAVAMFILEFKNRRVNKLQEKLCNVILERNVMRDEVVLLRNKLRQRR